MSSSGSEVREIVVETRVDADGVRVSVGDSGPGLKPWVQGRVFEPFVTTKGTGTGMGLSICSSIIENHRGRLWVESKEGAGATFTFTLPIERHTSSD